jgi:two-component system, OmpR family, osmolarity sensor histidine kinase EnvZ
MERPKFIKPEHPTLYWRLSRFLERYMPVGLYKRALIIVAAPIVLLQSIMAGIILDQHWDQVTKVLSRSLSREIGLMIELYDASDKGTDAILRIEDLTNRRLGLELTIQRGAELPQPLPAPFLSAVDTRLNRYLTVETGRPYWIDSSGQPDKIDIRVEVEPGLVFRILAPEARAYAVGTNAFLYWMVLSSLVLLGIALAFLHNQIRPIIQLSKAARNFGLGRSLGEFHPRGAAEVREASEAFLSMKERIERHVEQRTGMLAGVSHDLRTVLTRFRLELAFLKDSPRTRALKEDVDEMQRMLEAYMAFVRGDGGEKSEPQNIGDMLRSIGAVSGKGKAPIAISSSKSLVASVKPNAFRRLMTNLIGNASRYAGTVKVDAVEADHHLTITVDDDGPGIPEHLRGEVFKPFVRLDHARNQDETGTGLGLAIALDIARAHGGDVKLGDSPLGGLRAVVEIPVQ